MAVSLKKGQGVNLRKDDGHDLSKVTIGLGWDVIEQKRGLLGSLFGPKTEDYDLDAIAFLLDRNDKITTLGRQEANGAPTLKDGDVVFFNSLRHPSGAVWLTGDNRTGAGDGDDEQIIANLDALPDRYDAILFVVSIYQGRQKGQHFGGVKNAFIRMVDARNKELCRFDISAEPAYQGMCSMTFAKLKREGGGWKFEAIGVPHATDRFVDLLVPYVPQ